MTAIWDERLITRHHAADMAALWDLKLDHPYLRCLACDGNITKLPAIFNVDALISAVVRHMTMNHGYSLSGSGYGPDDDSTTPDVARINRSNRSAGDPVH